jgi:hypothetical protein
VLSVCLSPERRTVQADARRGPSAHTCRSARRLRVCVLQANADKHYRGGVVRNDYLPKVRDGQSRHGQSVPCLQCDAPYQDGHRLGGTP